MAQEFHILMTSPYLTSSDKGISEITSSSLSEVVNSLVYSSTPIAVK
jgi:hypothetical protein